MKICFLVSLSPAARGHLRDWRTELPGSPGCSQDQADKGRGREELMKGRDCWGSLETSRNLPGKLHTAHPAPVG